ncbi:MAG: PIG-L deacetylase family protein [Ferrimicrobium sp.]|jgi:LmbE family N-acetylglucosaminyl deacetylase|uniref:PIG-L deacetylase family protein n=1 Tax=Ferrimicrobium acidiphilum TaxID=121039 RepID=A0ABV3Y1X3_9ACTN|nr:PIG-L deacetylase family protein [Ferrimicrobium sp.]MDA8400987.1 PIG-L family deacetylase [Actinomycetota bacterium]
MTGQRDGIASYLVAADTDTTADLPTPASVLAIGAHPDDVEFGCGATLAKWTQYGARVHIGILTDGRRGSWSSGQDQLALAVARQNESRDAAHVLRADPPSFFQQIDGELRATPELIMRLVALLRSLHPDVVITHDPWKRYRLHPDHRIAGEVTIDAIVQARDASFWPELTGAPTRPSALLLFEADSEDHSETITKDHLRSKAEALACHQSQYVSSYGLASDASDADQKLLARLCDVARDPANNTYRERFKRITDL